MHEGCFPVAPLDIMNLILRIAIPIYRYWTMAQFDLMKLFYIKIRDSMGSD